MALEVGCGTGPVCCFLAERGFRVEGVDVSQTAIAMARSEAARRGLDIRYRVADICRGSVGRQSCDLVVDGHCLHCLVRDDDRRRALAAMREAVKPEGAFWLETMLAGESTSFGDDTLLDEDGVLWVPISRPGRFDMERQVEGKTYVANRRVHRQKDRLISELCTAGFAITWSEVDVPAAGESAPGRFRAICRPG